MHLSQFYFFFYYYYFQASRGEELWACSPTAALNGAAQSSSPIQGHHSAMNGCCPYKRYSAGNGLLGQREEVVLMGKHFYNVFSKI